MKITTITKDNLEYFKDFITSEDEKFINEDLKILPIGLVADELKKGENIAAGAICIRPDDFLLNITSFYVAPEFRGKGGGKFLLDETKRIFGQENMEFNTEFLIYGKEQEDLANFLEEYGFTYADPEYDCYLTTVGDLKNTKLFGKKGSGIEFSEIDQKLLKHATGEAEKSGAMTPVNGLTSPRIDKDVSVGIINNGILESYLVFENISKDLLLLSAIHSKDKSPVELLHMLEKSTDLLQKKFTKNHRILIQPVDEAGEDIILNLFEDINDISCRYRYVI